MAESLWEPTPAWIKGARITGFLERAGLADLSELALRADRDPAWFTERVVEELGIEWFTPPQQILDLSAGISHPKWFRGARINIAHECVTKQIDRSTPALIWESEAGERQSWSYRRLEAESNRLARGLKALGLARGDRVGLFLPMIPEAVAALFAIARLGAIAVPIFSGFGPEAVAGRLADSGARFLITADGVERRGKAVAMKATADSALVGAPSVERVVVVRRTGEAVPWSPGRDRWYHAVLATESHGVIMEQLDPEEPFMIIYTSGTTGRPKGSLHVHGGFPLKAAQDIALCYDLKPGERLFWFSDLGWMMGPWLLLGTLLLGGTAFLYDGAPDYPGPDRIWAMVARHQITHLGVAPTIIRSLMAQGDEWPAKHDLSSLRVIGGAGEPWNPEPYRWFFEKVGGGRCPLVNYSGGTETSGGILGCTVTRPIKECGFNWAIPGMGATVLDESGLEAAPGTVGELALRVPWVGITRSFWQADDRYRETYWSRFPGVWVHGDWVSRDAEGDWWIHGRSDDTLKIAGKRLGPAEYESILVSHPGVLEAAAIAVPHPVKGEVVHCFVVRRPLPGGGAELDALGPILRDLVAAQLGKALAPDRILFVGALPKTRNAKVMRRVIKAAYLGRETGDLSALENPEAVDGIRVLQRKEPTNQP